MESGTVSQIEKDVAELRAMIGDSEDLKALLRSPLVKARAQQDALTALADAAQFSHLTKNFLLTLAQNRRLADIDNMLTAVTENISARRGELRAKVESAIELSDAQKKALEETLAARIGHPVAVDASVNRELIGGVTVTLGSLLIDDSIRTKLERMGRAMKHNAKAA